MLSDAKRSVFWSGVQQISVFGLQLITTLIVARLISPDDYGIIAMTIVFFSIAQVILDFGMEGALIQKKECTQKDYDTAFLFSTVMSLVFYTAFYFTSGLIADYFEIPQLEKVIKISAVVLVIRAIGIAPYSKMQRELRFRNLARISAIVTLVAGAVAIYMAYEGYAYWALVAQTLLSAAAMTLLYFLSSRWMPTFKISAKSFSQLISFGFPMMLTSLINAVYSNLYTLVIGKKFDKKQLGLFNRASTFAGYVPTNLSDFSLRALYPIFSRYQDNIPLLRQQAVRTMHLTAFIAVPINLFFLVNAKDIVLLLLKDRWIDIVPMIRLMCAAHLSYIVCNIHMNLFKAIKRTDRLFICETIKKVLGVIILIVTVPMGIMPMIWGLLAFNFLNIIIGALFIHPLTGLNLTDHLKSLVPTCAIAAISVIAAFYPASMFGNIYARVITSGIIAASLFIGISYMLKDEAVSFFLGYFRHK